MQALFVHQLTNLDFSYLCPMRGLVGETWLVDATLWGELDEQGMVFDFSLVKKKVKAILDSLSDHRLVVPLKAPETAITQHKEQLSVIFESNHGVIQCSAPTQAVLLVNATTITPDILSHFLQQALHRELPENIDKVELSLYPEDIAGAYYHYSHGLKKHSGDCQRIAHGHRSQIKIFVNEQRNQSLETLWASKWCDTYIATREDLQNTFTDQGIEYYRFSYTATQGDFELILPSTRCYIIETDTTVELLANHIATVLADQKPGFDLRVRAFEGFNKGAIASRP